MASQDVEHMSYPELLDRKEDILTRLESIEIKDAPRKKPGKQKNSSSCEIPYAPKTDTHWDFVMKEMMWLGADFQGERKRQHSLAKKCASSVKQYHKTKETRRLRELQQAEMKRRKLGAKIGRDIKSWWTKIERVISYKQKLKADEERQKAMNKQLVVLVQQTEKYSESLTKQRREDASDSDGDDTSMNSDSDYPTKGKRRRKRLTIEEALAAERNRKSKYRVVDYARMRLDNNEFYGESTASDSGSDASYTPDSDTDDETTLKEAIDVEIMERKQRGAQKEEEFQADPEELRKLHEEIEMDIESVIERFKLEGKEEIPHDGNVQSATAESSSKRVKFLDNLSESEGTHKIKVDDPPRPVDPVDPGNDADDDGDASDVEDYNHTQSDEEDFSDCEPAADDETTIAQEERLPRDMSTTQEIDLLKKESEMSLEELQKLYAGISDDSQSTGSALQNDEDQADETIDENEAYLPATGEVDDETTMDAEEKLGRELSHDEEMSLLQQDSQIPIEELRAMHEAMNSANGAATSDGSASDSVYAARNGQSSNESTNLVPGSAAAMLATAANSDGDEDIEEYQVDEMELVDDETTLVAEERFGREISYEEEISVLKTEGEIPIEQLRSMYQSMPNEEPDGESDTTENTGSTNAHASAMAVLLSSAGDMDIENDEYEPNAVEGIDDETTLEAEERLGRDMSYKDELELLKKESEMSFDELRALYANVGAATAEDDHDMKSESSVMEGDTNGESNVPNSFGAASKRKREAEETNEKAKKYRKEQLEDAASDDGATALSALEASAERARKTLASRPYLLANWVKLRKYQQVGLNWLVSLQSRRLNGILADGKLFLQYCSRIHLAPCSHAIYQRWGWVRRYRRLLSYHT